MTNESLSSKVLDLLTSLTDFDRPQIWPSSHSHDNRSVYELIEKLLGTSGEVSGGELARKVHECYANMDDSAKVEFFNYLATSLDVDPDEVRAALIDYEAEPTKSKYRAFMAAAEPKRQELFRRLNRIPAATERLVKMRQELLVFCKHNPRLATVDLDLKHLFVSWFNRGFLVLKPINWSTPASILEKIIEYEAVHEITSWNDLRNRLHPSDRRCFALFHPAMPQEPLIFVEVGLVQGVPNSIQSVLSDDREFVDAHQADTAVFYSISNCQTGLSGISFGNSLIKQVVADLSHEFPRIKTFVTLSPIPGFREWLEETERGQRSLQSNEIQQLVAKYLLTAKRSDGFPRDPVARFHLGNGASIFAIHSAADSSEKGAQQSLGAMVNYLYKPPKISENHERFVSEKKIAKSASVESLNRAANKANL